MYLKAGIKRGSAELAVLSVLAREALHGYEIAKRIDEGSGGELKFSLASLYPMLYSLERRALIRGSWSDAANGRRRRTYRITPAGKKELDPLRQEWRTFFRALDRLTGVADA
jgi:PadR family transcriptional regulator, regulatory protein PadR